MTHFYRIAFNFHSTNNDCSSKDKATRLIEQIEVHFFFFLFWGSSSGCGSGVTASSSTGVTPSGSWGGTTTTSSDGQHFGDILVFQHLGVHGRPVSFDRASSSLDQLVHVVSADFSFTVMESQGSIGADQLVLLGLGQFSSWNVSHFV